MAARANGALLSAGMAEGGEEQRFGAALQRELHEADRTHAWLAAEIARVEGRRGPYSQQHASDWINGRRNMSPSQVFAAEVALDLEPGTLSQLLGYLPVGARSVVTVEDAIAADPALGARDRAAMLALYRSLTDSGT